MTSISTVKHQEALGYVPFNLFQKLLFILLRIRAEYTRTKKKCCELILDEVNIVLAFVLLTCFRQLIRRSASVTRSLF